MTAPTKPKYLTTSWKDYNTALKSRGLLLIWLDKDMCWHGSASGKRGRSPKYSEAAVQFCLTDKGLFNLPLRQAMGMTQSLLALAGLGWQVPGFSTVSRRQKHLSVTIGAQPTTTRLHLLVDSTGIKMLGEGEWKTKKHGADYRRQRRKIHLGIDAATLEIRPIEVADNATGDTPMLPCLLEQIPAAEVVASVSGDGAYDTKGCHEAIAQRGAQALIPTRKNAKPWKDRRPGAKARNAIVAATRRLGRTIWKKWSGYHRRSLDETKMRCLSCLVNASWRVTLTARSPSCMSVPPSSIALHGWARPRRWQLPCRKSVWGLGYYALNRFMQKSRELIIPVLLVIT